MPNNPSIMTQEIARLGSVDNISIEDYRRIKFISNHDTINPQNSSFVEMPVNKSHIICLESESLINLLILQYLIFFRNPQNDKFAQLIEAQIIKQSNSEIKLKNEHSLMIYKEIISRDLQCWMKRDNKVLDRQQQAESLQKSIHSNFPTLKVNNGLIMSLIEFLKSSSVSCSLQNRVISWIDQSSVKMILIINQKKIEQQQNNNKYQSQQVCCIIQFGNITQEILVVLSSKLQTESQQSQFNRATETQTQQNSNPYNHKLILFPNLNTLSDYLQTYNQSHQQTQSPFPIKSYQYQPSQLQLNTLQSTNNSHLSFYHQKSNFNYRTQNNFNLFSCKEFNTIIFLFLIICLYVFVYYCPENPFALKACQFSFEMEKLFEFAILNLLQEFFSIIFQLYYTHDWNINSLIKQ